MRRIPGTRQYSSDFEEIFGEPEENLEEAAKALLDPGQVTLQALSHELSPMCVRRRLVSYLAGIAINSRPKPRLPDNPFIKKPKTFVEAPTMPMGYTMPRFPPIPRLSTTPPSATSSTMRVTRVLPGKYSGPIVAHIRRPQI